ncbi:MAG: Fic family protein [Terracidiphilus sp.]|jgi:Fic family protein
MLNTDKIQISHEMLLMVGELDAFKGAWIGMRSIGQKPLSALRRAAGMESIAASVRMAGGQLTNGRIERLMEETVEIDHPAGEEFDPLGYAEALTKILHGWKQMPVNEERILRLHFALMGFGRRAGKEAGEYKSWAKPLAAGDEEGRKAGITLQTAPAAKTPERMGELVAWLDREERAGKMHKLLLTGMFVARLLAIHPFLEGNGRLSRLLTTLLLLRFGYGYVPYSSLEAVLEGSGEEYEHALRRTQMTLDGDAPDWEPWLMFFLGALREQKRRLAEKVKEERKLQANQTELAAAILERVRKEGRVTIGEMIALTGRKRETLRWHFQNLVRERRLAQHGTCKGTWYSMV